MWYGRLRYDLEGQIRTGVNRPALERYGKVGFGSYGGDGSAPVS